MELKPHISLSRGRVNKQRQAMNRIHSNCAIVFYELRDALGAKMSNRRKKRVAGDTQASLSSKVACDGFILLQTDTEAVDLWVLDFISRLKTSF